MDDIIRIKPHHLVDIITSYGRGMAFEPHAYGHDLHVVAKRLLSDRDAMLEIELGADDVCGPCVHNVDGACDDKIDTSYRPEAPASKQEWNLRIDRRWCERLGIEPGERLTARQFCERLRDHAGSLDDIYPEMPVEHTADRARNMRAGVARVLADD